MLTFSDEFSVGEHCKLSRDPDFASRRLCIITSSSGGEDQEYRKDTSFWENVDGGRKGTLETI